MLTMVLCYGSQNLLNIVYLFHGATSFRQYTETTYLLCTTIAIGICYTIIASKIEDLFEFIESLSKLIEESE